MSFTTTLNLVNKHTPVDDVMQVRYHNTLIDRIKNYLPGLVEEDEIVLSDLFRNGVVVPLEVVLLLRATVQDAKYACYMLSAGGIHLAEIAMASHAERVKKYVTSASRLPTRANIKRADRESLRLQRAAACVSHIKRKVDRWRQCGASEAVIAYMVCAGVQWICEKSLASLLSFAIQPATRT